CRSNRAPGLRRTAAPADRWRRGRCRDSGLRREARRPRAAVRDGLGSCSVESVAKLSDGPDLQGATRGPASLECGWARARRATVGRKFTKAPWEDAPGRTPVSLVADQPLERRVGDDFLDAAGVVEHDLVFGEARLPVAPSGRFELRVSPRDRVG